jgi:hypothetical protein
MKTLAAMAATRIEICSRQRPPTMTATISATVSAIRPPRETVSMIVAPQSSAAAAAARRIIGARRRPIAANRQMAKDGTRIAASSFGSSEALSRRP